MDKQTSDVSKAELISEAKGSGLRLHSRAQILARPRPCKPELAASFTKATGLAPVSARWVLTWKVKEGVRGVKARLCLRSKCVYSCHAYLQLSLSGQLQLLSLQLGKFIPA